MPMFMTAPITVGKNGPLHPEYDALVGYAPSDSVDCPLNSTGEGPRALLVGGAGNVSGILVNGGTFLLTAPTVGQIHTIAFSRINATGTTATALQLLY